MLPCEFQTRQHSAESSSTFPLRRNKKNARVARSKDMFWVHLLLTAAIALCSWLSRPGSSLNRSAWQAFDCAVAALSQGDEKDEGDGTSDG